MGIFSIQRNLPPLPKENEHYCFLEIEVAGEQLHAIKLLDGPYQHVIYYYGHVKLVPDGDSHRLAFQYTVWDSAGHSRELLGNSEEFRQFIGDVLVSIIADEQLRGELHAPSRTDDSEDPDL